MCLHVLLLWCPEDGPDISALLIGNILPEDTGDDTSLLALETPDIISRDTVFSALKAHDLMLCGLEETSAPYNVEHRCYLLSVSGFITEDKESAKDLLQRILSISVLDAYVIGVYANPVLLKD